MRDDKKRRRLHEADTKRVWHFHLRSSLKLSTAPTMAVSSSAWTLLANGMAVSTSIIAAALALKLSVLSISELTKVQISLLWLEPSHIYLVINGIIVTIAASFKI
ncbi:hypothetical protein NL676_034714 [Syzygium grande]|nr:hypothetical protein NL676_034714 [Syzygium grande]